MLRFFVVLAVAVVAVNAGSKAKCPMAMGKYPFNAEKFAGDWYIVAGCQTISDMKGKCGKINMQYQKNNDKDISMTSRYSGINLKDNSAIKMESITVPALDERLGLGFMVFRPEGTSNYRGVYKESVVATDYETYALIIACRPNFDQNAKTFEREIYAEILSRPGVTLSKETIATLSSVLTSYDMEPSDIKLIDNTNCS